MKADRCAALREAAASQEVAVHAWSRGGYPGRRLPPNVLPGLRSVGYWDATKPQTWGLDWHRNEGFEVTVLTRGRLPFAVEAGFTGQPSTHALRRGDVTLTLPWQLHRVGDPLVGPSRLNWLIVDVGMRRPNQRWKWPNWIMFSRSDRDTLATRLRERGRAVWRADSAVLKTFEAFEPTLRGERFPHSELALLVNQCLLALLTQLRDEDHEGEQWSAGQEAVGMVLREVAAHPERDWDLDEMALASGMGRTRFVHHCRRLANASPVTYLNRCRVERAKALLQEEAKITEVAGRCGFSSSQYFATVFRSVTGSSPRVWRSKLTVDS